MLIPLSRADWRVNKVGTVRGDQWLFDSFVKDGTLLWVTTQTFDDRGNSVSFPTPSPAAIALNVSINAAHRAAKRKPHLGFKTLAVRPLRGIADKHITDLYEFFEDSMLASVFAFQALEAYANVVISERLATPMTFKRSKTTAVLTPTQIEREVSTDEKLRRVVPTALGVKAPTGTKLWERYKWLKDVRDSTVHLKSHELYVRGKPDRESLYYRFLNASPLDYPTVAIKLIEHYADKDQPRWLEAVVGRLAKLRP